MRLKEFEVKEILIKEGFTIPESVLVSGNEGNLDKLPEGMGKAVVKVQTYRGGRGNKGGIVFCSAKEEILDAVNSFLHSQFNGETIEEVLVEKKVPAREEYYAGFIFDTEIRAPVLIISKDGGMDIEENLNQHSCISINILEGLKNEEVIRKLEELNFPEEMRAKLASLVARLWSFFCKYDFRMLELNPIIRTDEDEIVIADALGEIDDNALFRQNLPFRKRVGLRAQTEMEMLARKIDEENHNGVCGRTFVELDGDIAVLASGGGASLTAMDALLSYGGKPANYAEYSGNPPAEKVEKLTRITLSRPGLKGCFIVGGTANFTRVDITMKGVIEGLKKVNPKYPIVVRRAGPGDAEAYKILKEAAKTHGFDIHVFDETTPITKSAKVMAELAEKYDGNTD